MTADNIFSKKNFTIKYEHRAYETKWRIQCSYRLGNWIEEQDKNDWVVVGSRHLAIYDISPYLMEKILILSALTT